MGQRTQMVVEVTETKHNYKTDKDSRVKHIGSYHNQWGMAKMQLFDVMRFLTTYNGDYEDYKLPEKLHKAWLMNDEYVFKGKVTPERVMEWMNTTQDNNDGGVLLKVKMDRYGYIESGELYIFNDPERDYSIAYERDPKSADGRDFKVDRYVTLLEYINYWPKYFNEEFLTAFTALLRFYNIKIIEPKEEEDV